MYICWIFHYTRCVRLASDPATYYVNYDSERMICNQRMPDSFSVTESCWKLTAPNKNDVLSCQRKGVIHNILSSFLIGALIIHYLHCTLNTFTHYIHIRIYNYPILLSANTSDTYFMLFLYTLSCVKNLSHYSKYKNIFKKIAFNKSEIVSYL